MVGTGFSMDEILVRIIDGTYSVERGSVRVELFGRAKDGSSVTLVHKGFFPYFYIISPDSDVLGELREDDNVISLQKKILNVDNIDQNCFKVTIKRPFDVPSYKRKYGKSFKFLAADIPFVQRFFFDFDLGSVVKVRGNYLMEDDHQHYYTTDSVFQVAEIEASPSFKTDLKILSFDLENSIKMGRILCICCAVKQGQRDVEYHVFTGDEESIITDFIHLVKREDPDILTGYNIENYDIPYIIDRMAHNHIGTELILGRNNSGMSRDKGQPWRCTGRCVMDAWWQVKIEVKPKRETLSYVSSKLLGLDKLDVDASNIDEEWSNNSEKVIEYCKRDALLPMKLLERIGVLQKSVDLAQVSRLPLAEVVRGRTSVLIDSLLIREADAKGIGVPMTSHSAGGKNIVGGYVHSMQPGLYHWVCVLDFKSMYPMIMIANNICFTTLLKSHLDSPNRTKDTDSFIVAPNGARFIRSEIKRGILPALLEKLMMEREAAKRMAQSARGKEEKEYYEGFQYAIKILMNAFYGIFASNFYRFTDKNIGSAITGLARKNITSIINELQKEGISVLYSDTDSIFIKSPFLHLEETISFGKDLSKRYSKAGAVLEFENILSSFFAHGVKKRYAGKIIWPEEDILVRGYEIRRSDSFDLLSDTLKKVFNIILSGEDEEKSVKKMLKEVREVVQRLRRGEVDKKKLLISKTVKSESHYKFPDRLPHVQAMKKLMKKDPEFTPGMKVAYIVTDSSRNPQEVEPVTDERNISIKPDMDYYSNRLAKSLSRVTEVFGYDMKYLLESEHQSSIDGWVGTVNADGVSVSSKEITRSRESNTGSSEDSENVKEGKKTLLDFM